MIKDKFDYEKMMASMFEKWLDGLTFLEDSKKEFILEFAFALKKYREELFKLYDAIIYEKEIKKENELITYEIYENKNKIGFNNKSINISKESLKVIVRTIIDFTEEILPLGSIVTLKKDVLDSAIEEEKYFIISHRFLTKEGINTYFPYGAVVYPVGTMKEEKILQFNSAFIKEVIYPGFSNEKEESFIASIKNELILKRGMYSINFATEEERKTFD